MEKKILEDDSNILLQRHISVINDFESFNLKVLNRIIDTISCKFKHINLESMHYKIISRNNTTGYSMKWHIDDGQIIDNILEKQEIMNQVPLQTGCEHSPSQYKDSTNYIKISDNKSIFYKDIRPKYSLLYYESNYGNDFNGGKLEFADDTIVEPKKGMFIFFDSREVHKVSEIISGQRINTLVKFY